MYRITLTANARKAYDWIGDRYAVYDMLRLFTCEGFEIPEDADKDWDYEGAISYDIPEHVAWEICQTMEENPDWDSCLGWEAVEPFETLRERVV